MRILSITSPDLSNGLGCRLTIWVAGCSHRCPGCHNKHTWDYNKGTDISDTENAIEFLSIIKEQLDKSYISGVTFSGGDPLDQNEESLKQLLTLIKAIKEDYPDKNIWIYSGDIFENLVMDKLKFQILSYCNFLVDGPYIENCKTYGLAFRGSDNQRIIDLQKTIQNNIITELEIP